MTGIGPERRHRNHAISYREDNMRAIVVNEYVKDVNELRSSNIEDPTGPGEGEVIVNIKYASSNFFDILMVQGKYQHKPDFPFIPGAEFSGVVECTGEGVELYKPGDRVYGSALCGGYGEKILVHQSQLKSVPSRLSFQEAAGIHITYPTSYAGLVFKGQLRKGEWCLVHAGAGGVGIAAAQIAKALGAKVIGTAGSDEKLAVMTKYAGADHVINYAKDDWIARVKEITKGHGADVVYDPVGLVEESTKCIAWNGRIIVVGFAAGKIPKIATNRILLKNISIVGVHWGAYLMNEPERIPEVFRSLHDMFESELLRPVVYPVHYKGLDAVPDALEALGGRKTYGKVVVNVSGNSSSL